MIHTIVTYDPSGNVSDTITLDCVKSYSEVYTSTVTTNPVESGTNITDDIIHEQDRFAMSGVVSDYAFRRKGYKVAFVNGEFVSDTTDDTPDTRNELPSLYIKDTLRRIVRDGEIVRLIRSADNQNPLNAVIESYFPCVVTSLTVNDVADGAIEVSLNMQKIEVAQVVLKSIDKATRRLIPFIKPNEEKANTKEGEAKVDGVGKKTAEKDGSSTDKITGDPLIASQVKANEEESFVNSTIANVYRNPKFDTDYKRAVEVGRQLIENGFTKTRVIFWLREKGLAI